MKGNEDFRVVLINPTSGMNPAEFYAPTEHLGLAYLTAMLRQHDFTVRIIDAYALNLTYEETLREALDASPDFVGITAEYNTIETAISLIRDIRSRLPQAHLALGGQHATYSSLELLSDVPELNSVMRGEGEFTIVELMLRLRQGQDLQGVDGVYYRNAANAIVQNNERAATEDLNLLPFPARDTLEACLAKGLTPAISILTSRGCYANCSFCNASKYFNLGGGKRWRARTAENVADELEQVLQLFKDQPVYEVIYFNDENFIGPGKAGIERAEGIAQEILDRNLQISFELFCRADSFNGHEETVALLSRAGLISALVGLESGYQKGLNKFNKGTTVNENLNTIELFRKYNIITSSSGFLMFHPYSTLKELEENAKFLLSIGMASLYNMSLKVLGYPGIRMVNDLREDGMLTADFGHLNVSGYRFTDPRVALMVEAMNFDYSLARKEDAAHRYLDFQLANMDRKFAAFALDDREQTELERHKAEVNDLRFRANLVTYNFFIKTLMLCETGWNLQRFEELQTDYKAEIAEALDTMNDGFSVYLDYLDVLVS